MIVLGFTTSTSAEIPKELLYQTPENTDPSQIATIQGFQETETTLKYIKSRIYISFINDKATLNQSTDWEKVYQIPAGNIKVRYISNAQHIFSSGEIIFKAQAGQHYQVTNNQAEKKSIKNGISFWIENLDTHEIITPKQTSKTSFHRPQASYIPVIINQ
jgi:hypothetical protein